jgi:flagellar motility protein MotE (MotC chaperone)
MSAAATIPESGGAASALLRGLRQNRLRWLLPIVAAACLLRALILPIASGPVASALVPAVLVEPAILEPGAEAGPVTMLPVDIAPAAGPATAADPPLNPQALLEVAAELKEQRRQLAEREQALAARETALKPLQQQLAVQLGQPEKLRDELRALLGQVKQEDEQQIDRLVKVYESMKSAKAAPILDSMELDLLVPVLRRMREAKIAAIVEEMNLEGPRHHGRACPDPRAARSRATPPHTTQALKLSRRRRARMFAVPGRLRYHRASVGVGAPDEKDAQGRADLCAISQPSSGASSSWHWARQALPPRQRPRTR